MGRNGIRPILLALLLIPMGLAIAAEALLEQARSLETEQRFAEAGTVYREYLVLNPEDDEVRATLARLLAWQGRYDEAAALYQNILNRYPADEDVRTGLGRVRAWQGEFDEAERLFREVLRDAPGNLDARRGLADTLYWRGEPAAALEQYRALLTLDPPERAEIEQRVAAIEAEPGVPPIIRPEPRLLDRDYLKLGFGRYDYTRGIRDERYAQLEVSRSLGERTLLGRLERIDRFGIRDVLLTGEFYSPLWTAAWGYLSLETGIDAEIVPRWAVGGELFQGLGGLDPGLSGVELSLGYRHVRFRAESVDIVVPGVTLYLPHDLWITGKLFYVPDTNARTWSTELNWQLVPRMRLRAGWSTGTAAERLQTAEDILRLDTAAFTVGAILPLNESLSLEVRGVRENRKDSYRRRGAEANLIVRW